MSKKETNFTLIFYILVDFLRKTILLSKKNIYIRSTNQHYYTINRLLEKEKADRFFLLNLQPALQFGFRTLHYAK